MLYQSILILHVVTGFFALLFGALAIASQKGQKNHLKTGKAYVLMMYSVGLSAIAMTFLKPNPFLFTVGVFTLYLTYTGQRSIFYFRLKEDYRNSWKDLVPILFALVIAAGMILQPIFRMLESQSLFVSVMGVFGVFLMGFAIRDLRLVIKNPTFKPNQKSWLIQHIGRIGGAYIATLTAFLVTNLHFNLGWIIWLAPTLVGSFLLAKVSRDWKKKLKIQP
ncbi:DUF2306 domain-containing protein [Algoriphagus taiwanensis]|uniref:DUF2306 domain-containing protein n=1 Tax=Algoriphagus taiwanensis TaxID=1445656 RepID=A0ABQ6Q1N2_9BACT|nr:hypothetical protein Ataiwa_16550 [Algoriphagus taiwanensis]